MSKTKNAIKGWWAKLRKPSVRYSILTLFGGGFIAGILFWGGFNTGMEATNEMEFCLGCHEMKNTVYVEYKKTIHYSNRTGVRAQCSDCHVPKEWTYKIIRKIQASREVWGKITGTINTMEKFEAKRLELATREWARMKANDSLECRNCHSFEGMDTDKQKHRASKLHASAIEDKQTCIDCHKGIAHQRPKGMPEEDV